MTREERSFLPAPALNIMTHTVKILETQTVTHNVRRLTVEKPEGYRFEPGQATDVALDKEGWRDEQRPFTFTSLGDWEALEFTIKIYPEHDGVTKQIGDAAAGDQLLIDDPWGAIRYKGPGCFIAGGAGVTPFIAILRDLETKDEVEGNRLIFANKAERDIILRDEFEAMNGLDVLLTVTDDPTSDLAHGRIDRDFLETHIGFFGQAFYVCGPQQMVEDVSSHLKALGADPAGIVFEE